MTRFLNDEAKGFPLWSAFLLLVLVLAAWLIPWKNPLARAAVIYGGLISAGTSLSGFALAVKSNQIDAVNFIKIFLGGMIARMGLALAALAAGIALFDFPATVLVISCLTSYFIFTLLEYIFLLPLLTRKLRQKSHD